ncbi:hypothetical protein E4K67_18480 [Desulfosporosinus fructosivorans]|uniref:Uncharacterized protein n=1 Tax=Desulfosporosinus fructosivorans TaxID=2018669 RepID=A0A4Z0R4G7_9FIRM|nr:hypothetical protein [Desulfosporosinus fructosivorans]TGE37063.1 hypothetical protein E4K67_18480 [Desulfosporosinus fructosivorans]
MSEITFAIITWIPLIALEVAVILAFGGLYLKLSQKPYKKALLGATFALSIPAIFGLIYFIMGTIGF